MKRSESTCLAYGEVIKFTAKIALSIHEVTDELAEPLGEVVHKLVDCLSFPFSDEVDRSIGHILDVTSYLVTACDLLCRVAKADTLYPSAKCPLPAHQT